MSSPEIHTSISHQSLKHVSRGTSNRKMLPCMISSSLPCAVLERAPIQRHAKPCGSMSRDSMARRRGSRTSKNIEVSPQLVLELNIHGGLGGQATNRPPPSNPAIQRVSFHHPSLSSTPLFVIPFPSSRSRCKGRIWNSSTSVSGYLSRQICR